MSFNSQYDRFFSRGLEIWHSHGELSAVKEYVYAIEDQDYRDVTLGRVGVFLAEHERADDALQFIRAIQQNMERADAFLNLARAHAQKGDYLGAKTAYLEAVSAAEGIQRSTWETPSILLQASAELHHLSCSADALAILRRAINLARKGGDYESANVLGGAGVLLAKWGLPDEATSVVGLISEPGLRKTTEERLKAILS